MIKYLYQQVQYVQYCAEMRQKPEMYIPGGPWNPTSPTPPGGPGFPGGPTLPGGPRKPCGPGTPGVPCGPGLPGNPLEPVAPGEPGPPVNTKTHCLVSLYEFTHFSKYIHGVHDVMCHSRCLNRQLTFHKWTLIRICYKLANVCHQHSRFSIINLLN